MKPLPQDRSLSSTVRSFYMPCSVRWALLLAVAVVTLGASSLLLHDAGAHSQGAARPEQQQQSIRIGTYDSRAVAIACGRSDSFLNEIAELRRRHEQAKKEGDMNLAAKLESQGQMQQVRMHLQAFSNAPIDDVLARVKDKLPQVARQRDVLAITPHADFHDSAVELVDVTDDLVALFEPDKQTRKLVSQIRDQAPLPIEDVAKMDHAKD